MTKYKWTEIAEHTEMDDCWIVIEKKVFNVSEFLPKHPGGRWIILEYAGKDATPGFQKTIHSPIAIEMMADLYIGDLE